jgi:choline transport protein
VPANAYIFAQQILALISVSNPEYQATGWQAALLTIASAISAWWSVFVMQKLTLAEGLALATHCCGLVVFLAILWAMGPKADAHEIFFDFQDQSGWGSKGAATLVGIIGPVATFIGGDEAVHLAEKLQNASNVLPRAMVTGCAANYAIGLTMLIGFLFHVGLIDDSLYVYGGEPWVAVMYRITG